MRMLLVLAAVAQVTVIPRALPRLADARSGQAAPAKDYPIRAVPLTSVRITDGFWAPRRETNRTVTIPHIMQQNEVTGRIDNFLKAAKKKPGAYQGQRYNDTDVYCDQWRRSTSAGRVGGGVLGVRVFQTVAEG
jgi:hypothetical protein